VRRRCRAPRQPGKGFNGAARDRARREKTNSVYIEKADKGAFKEMLICEIGLFPNPVGILIILSRHLASVASANCHV